ncbi:hypothetical protein GCM10027190_25790 [Spirosoma areae]
MAFKIFSYYYGNNTDRVPTSRAIPKIMNKPISTVFNKLPGLSGVWFGIRGRFIADYQLPKFSPQYII